MKRFLSILLALAVGFTFTFGSAMSAFAADRTAEEFNVAVNEAEGVVLNKLAVEYDYASKTLTDSNVGEVKYVAGSTDTYTADTYAVEAKQWEPALKAAYDDTVKAIQGKSSALKGAYPTKQNDTIDQLVGEYNAVTRTNAELVTYAKGAKKAIGMIAQFEVDKAKMLADLAKVDTTIYSTTKSDAVVGTITVDGVATNYYVPAEYAVALVETAVAAVNKVIIEDTDDTAVEVYAKVEAINAAFTNFEVTTDPETKEETVTIKVSILTKATEDANNAANQATVASKKADLSSKIAEAYKAVIAANAYAGKPYPAEAIAEWNKLKDAYEEVETYLIENANNIAAHTVGNFPAYTLTYSTTDKVWTITENATHYMATVEANAANEKLGNALKLKKTPDGKDMYDAKSVDEKVSTTTKNNNEAITTAPTKLAEADFDANGYLTAYEKAALQKRLNDMLKNNEKNYYAPEFAEYKTLVEEELAIVNAATSDAELKAVKADIDALETKINAVKTKTGIYDVVAAFGTVDTEFAKLQKYINYVNGIYTDAQTNAKQFTLVKGTITGKNTDKNMNNKEFWIEFYGENGARDAKDIAGLYDAAIALIDGTIDASGVKALKDAAEDAVAKAAATDKASVKAAEAALDEYAKYGDETTVKGYGDYVLAKKTLAQADKKEVEAAKKAVPVAVTIADKDAVKNVVELMNAYNDETLYNSFADDYTGADIKAYTDLQEDIRALELKALQDAIDALPAVITEDAKAQVEAARVQYDAFVTEYDVVGAGTVDANGKVVVAAGGYDAVDEIGADKTARLETAEATLEVLAVVTPADAKAFLQDAVIKASSTVKNGKVTVTANADVQYLIDNGFTVEFKFYKSTKKSSGYKATVTKNAAESKTYTNTNPAKGANYYKYIIIVTDAEGNVVTKTALKECAYAKRTIK